MPLTDAAGAGTAIDRSAETKRYLAFSRPAVAGNEMVHVASAVANSADGVGHVYTEACESFIETEFEVGSALLVTSGTAALEMAAMLCDLGPGDEVIMPSFTFVTTAEAVVRTGATPVFVDVRPDTLNLDEALIEAAITPRTKAIWPIHYAGVAAAMDPIMAMADDHGLMVVEDAAQGVGAAYRSRPLGSIGHLAAYSFHETKNLNCSEGGALCVNSPELAARAEILRDKGTNRQQFQRGQADKYTWVDHGSSYVLSEFLAAYLYGQFEQLDLLRTHRSALWQRYDELLRPGLDPEEVALPAFPPDADHNHHIYHLTVDSTERRDELIDWLAKDGAQAVFHYVPLHSSPMGRKVGRTVGDMVHTDRAGSRLLRLPLYHEMTLDDATRVAERVKRFFDER